MHLLKFILAAFGIAVTVTASFLSCSSPNFHLATRKPLPPIIRGYEHVSVRGGQIKMKDTGIYISALAPKRLLWWQVENANKEDDNRGLLSVNRRGENRTFEARSKWKRGQEHARKGVYIRTPGCMVRLRVSTAAFAMLQRNDVS